MSSFNHTVAQILLLLMGIMRLLAYPLSETHQLPLVAFLLEVVLQIMEVEFILKVQALSLLINYIFILI